PLAEPTPARSAALARPFSIVQHAPRLEQGGPRPVPTRRARLPSAPDRAGGRRRHELTSEGVFTSERPERSGYLPPPRHAELLAQDIAVRFRRPRGDAEFLPDLFVRAPQRDQLDHLALALRQRELRVVLP